MHENCVPNFGKCIHDYIPKFNKIKPYSSRCALCSMILGISEGSDEENEIVGRKRPKGKRKVSIHMVDFFLLYFFFFPVVY